MPKRKPARRRVTSSSKVPKLMPFSLILPRREMNALREIASKEGVSVAAVIRRAIHTAIGHAHPEFMAQLLEAEADSFLDRLALRLPSRTFANARRRAFKGRVLKTLG